MPQLIVLDSAPLSMLTQRKGVLQADECRRWLGSHASIGTRIAVPEIIDYELRRELLRARKDASLARLDRLNAQPEILYIPLNTIAMRRAAELWAEARQKGIPTSGPDSLDIDCVLAAQAIAAAKLLAIDVSDVVVATSNVGHLTRYLNAELWQNI